MAAAGLYQGLTFNTESVMALPALAGCLLLVWSMQRKQLALETCACIQIIRGFLNDILMVVITVP
jgi:hypothetical protein